MKKLLFATLAAVLCLPLLTYAATYSYVAVTGEVKTIEADTASEAIALAPDIAPHSGVIIGDIDAETSFGVGGDPGDDGLATYQYVGINGELRTVEAVSADHALDLTVHIRADNSGVMLIG